MVGRKAVAVVVQVLERIAEHAYTQCEPHRGGNETDDARQEHVVPHQLVLAPAAREQRAQHRALLFYRRAREHHEHEPHDDHEQEQQHRPHGLVALHVVERVSDSLVVRGVDEVGELRVVVGEGLYHSLLDIRALVASESLVVKDERIVVHLALATEPLVACGVQDGDPKGERVEHEAVVVLEERLVVGERDDAADREFRVSEPRDVPYDETVVLAEDSVERNLAVRCGDATLGDRRQIHLRSRGIDATRDAVRAVTAHERGVYLLVEVGMEGYTEVANRVQGFLLRLEVAGKASILYAVGFLHVAHDGLYAARGKQKAAGERNGERHHEKEAQVLSQVVDKLAPVTPEERIAHATTPA